MAKKVQAYVKLQIPAGKANPSPPVGPALGQQGVNIMAFCKEFNAVTQKMEPGMPIPVVITVYSDRSFTFITKTPPATVLIKKAAGIESGSPTPHTKKVGKITRKQAEEIAKIKMPDLNASDMDSAVRLIAGSARSMGIEVVEKKAMATPTKKDVKGTKREKLFASKVEQGKTYPLDQAVQILKECATAKFKESIDISVNLGIDAKKSDQNVRGSTVLPHGNGKSVKVAVFAQGAKAEEAKAAGADIVGMQDLADKMKGGDMSYQVVIAEPAAMRVVGALGQVLGPRGLMPNPKTGTVTPDVAGAVKNAKAGMAKFKTDKAGIVRLELRH